MGLRVYSFGGQLETDKHIQKVGIGIYKQNLSLPFWPILGHNMLVAMGYYNSPHSNHTNKQLVSLPMYIPRYIPIELKNYANFSKFDSKICQLLWVAKE